MRAKPRATVIMPKVAMNGGILNLAIREPLTTPHTAPTANAAMIGTRTGTSKPGNLISAQSSRCARLVATTAARASKIVMLRRGEILEHGSHEELMSAGGAYAGMYRAFTSGLLEEM